MLLRADPEAGLIDSERWKRMTRAEILHVGNILNNGYLHCRYLRERGVAADSLNVDYRHCQGQPEWAEVHIHEPVKDWDQDWSEIDLQGFERPEWFFDVTIGELDNLARRLGGGAPTPGGGARNAADAFREPAGTAKAYAKLRRLAGRTAEAMGLASLVRDRKRARVETVLDGFGLAPEKTRAVVDKTLADYAAAYPDRGRNLDAQDVYDLLPRAAAYAPVLALYKLVHAYSLDPIYPMLGNPGLPFICYEHGTLREFPFEDSARGRLYALALKKAEKVIITNSDCKGAADRLGLDNCTFIPHIIDERFFARRAAPLRERLMRESGAELILVSPTRHDWKDSWPGHLSMHKRNDRLIRALGKLFRERPELKMLVVFFDWGQEAGYSKDLIRECGFVDKVLWEPLQSKPAISEFVNAADIVCDHFNEHCPTFGGIVPEGMACGKPVLVSFDADVHRWCYAEMPPLVSVHETDAILAALKELIDHADARRNLGEAAQDWFRRFHSADIVIGRLIGVYAEISARHGWGWTFG